MSILRLHKSPAEYVMFSVKVYLDRAELMDQCNAPANAEVWRATADALCRALNANDILDELAKELQAADHPDVRSAISLTIQKIQL